MPVRKVYVFHSVLELMLMKGRLKEMGLDILENIDLH